MENTTGIITQRKSNNNINNLNTNSKSDWKGKFAEKLSTNVVDEALLLLKKEIARDPAGFTGRLSRETSVDTLKIKRNYKNLNTNNTLHLKINESKIRCFELKVFEKDLQYKQSKEFLNGLCCNRPELDNY